MLSLRISIIENRANADYTVSAQFMGQKTPSSFTVSSALQGEQVGQERAIMALPNDPDEWQNTIDAGYLVLIG